MGIVIRQSLKGTFVNYIGVLLGIFVQMYICTKYLDPEVIGLTKVIYEVALLGSSFALLGSNNSAMRFFPYFRSKEKHDHGFFFYYVSLPIIGSLIVGFLYFLLQKPIISYFGRECVNFSEYFCWVFPLLFILTFWQFFENYSNIHMRIAVPKAIREVGMRLFMLACYLLYGFGYIGVEGLLMAFMVAYGLCMMMTGGYALTIAPPSMKHSAKEILTPDLKRKFFYYTGFLLLAAVSGNIMVQLDLFMLSSVRGMYSAGIYTIVIYMVAVIEMPTRSISAISAPIAADALKSGKMKEAESLYRQVSIHQLLASSMLLLLIWVNLDNIFAIIPNGEKFAAGRYAILFLGLSKIINSTLNFGNVLISFSKYYYWTLFIAAILTALTILTNLYLIPKLGISGAALATLITSIISYSYQQFLVQIKLKCNPLTTKTLLQLLVVLFLWGINYLIPSVHSFLPMLSDAFVPWIDLFLRSIILLSIGVFLIYRMKISPQILMMIDNIFRKR